MMDKVYATRSQSIMIFPLIGFFLVFGGIGFYLMVVSVIATGNIVGWILVFVFSVGFYSFLSLLYGNYVRSSQIALTDNSLSGHRLVGKSTEIRYDDIRVIQKRSLSANDLAIYSTDRTKTIYIHPLTEGFGELIEHVLSSCDNIRFVYLGDLTKKDAYWQKDPDWTIINSAIRRAQKNRAQSADQS